MNTEDYALGAASGSKLPQTLADDICSALDTLNELAGTVMDASERVHGSEKNTACVGGVENKLPEGWAEELRAVAAHAQRRGRNAVQELHRIRQTLGL